MTRSSRRRFAGLVALVVAALLWVQPSMATAAQPAFFPNWDANATFVVIPGTDDADGHDQLARTVGAGWFNGATVENGRVKLVSYPAAFGFRVFGLPVKMVGDGTYNDSTTEGSANAVTLVSTISGPVVINGFSQSAPIAMNAAYLLHKAYVAGVPGAKPDSEIVVLIGADPRFPNTGVEVVMPSIIDGLLTNGPRDTSDTGDIPITSICIIGDPTCGLANPLVNPFSAAFYALPGFYIHGGMYQHSDEYAVVRQWTDGNTTYYVLDGGNPWGMVLREFGIPVPKEVDTVLNALVPRQMPGERDTVAGVAVPTPRELQVALYKAFGRQVPVTDPDSIDRQQTTTLRTSNAADKPAVQTTDDQTIDEPAADSQTTVNPAAVESTTPDTPDSAPTLATTPEPVVATPKPGQNNWSRSTQGRTGHAKSTPGRNTWSRSRHGHAGSDSSGGTSDSTSTDSTSGTDSSGDSSTDSSSSTGASDSSSGE